MKYFLGRLLGAIICGIAAYICLYQPEKIPLPANLLEWASIAGIAATAIALALAISLIHSVLIWLSQPKVWLILGFAWGGIHFLQPDFTRLTGVPEGILGWVQIPVGAVAVIGLLFWLFSKKGSGGGNARNGSDGGEFNRLNRYNKAADQGVPGWDKDQTS